MSGYAQPTKTTTTKDTCDAVKCSEMQNDAGTEVSDWHKSDTTETHFVHDVVQTKENAASGATDHGVKDHKKHDISCINTNSKRKRSAMSLYCKDAHKRVAKCIGYALTNGTTPAWNKLLIILVAHLSEKERVELAWAALSACTDDHAYKVADSILYPSYGEEAA